jgi:5-methylcytosine-specific restriction protein A
MNDEPFPCLNPFARQCSTPGCGQPVKMRGKCATCTGLADARRGLNSDRQHKHLYDSARWQRVRVRILSERIFCECDDCVQGRRTRGSWEPSEVVHHRRPHHGDEQLFFDEMNLQALSKWCHDKLTGRTRREPSHTVANSPDGTAFGTSRALNDRAGVEMSEATVSLRPFPGIARDTPGFAKGVVGG